jgi:hypothetical protein
MDIISYEIPIVINSNKQLVPHSMNPTNNQIHDLVKDDEKFLHMQELIEAKRRMLLDKQKKLK